MLQTEDQYQTMYWFCLPWLGSLSFSAQSALNTGTDPSQESGAIFREIANHPASPVIWHIR